MIREAVEAIRGDRGCRRDHGKGDERPCDEESDPMHRVLQRLTIKYQACEADDGWRIGTPEAVLYHIYAGMCSDVSSLEPAIEPVAP